MAKVNDKSKTHPNPHPFDRMMFGDRHPTEQEPTKQDSDENKFDLVTTSKTMMETYQQLSPYVKGISNMVRKFKA